MRTTTHSSLRATLAVAVAGALVACSDSSPTGGYEADAVAPRVSVSNATSGDEAIVKATDNMSLKRVTVTLDGIGVLDTIFAVSTPTFEKRVPLATGVSSTLDVLARDGAGNVTAQTSRVGGGTGPAVTLLSPGIGAEAAPGGKVIVEIKATDDDGVRRLGFIVTTGSTKVGEDITLLPNGVRDTTIQREYTVASTAAEGSMLLVSAFAVDAVGDSTGGLTATVAVKSATTQSPPLVHQSVAPRVEATDSVSVDATSASGITSLGFTMTCARTGVAYQRDSTMPVGWVPRPVRMQLNVPSTCVGGTIYITSRATSGVGKTGYSVPTSVTTSQSDPNFAWRDSALAVYGSTSRLKSGARNALGVDIAVDAANRRVFVSNILNDRVDVWENGAFAKEVAVGSQPWGLFLSGGTLYVANSGGTNISLVPATGATATLSESVRYRTQNILAWDVIESRDLSTGTVRFTRSAPVDFSDRPQFLAVGASGKLYFSTKPTPSAPDGTIRVFDPTMPLPEPSQVGDYMSEKPGHVVILNADAVVAIKSTSNGISDTLVVCDHQYGTGNPTVCRQGTSASGVLSALRTALSNQTDVRMYVDADIESLGLTDTTFVAAGGDRRWIGFGEGNTAGAGRVMMINDATGFFSAGVQVRDLIGNASEPVSGLAINADSRLTAARGQEAYFFSVESPYHLRLEGKVATYPKGAGIAFHPQNVGNGSGTPPDVRLAFAASSNGTIEVMDSYFWGTRGTLPVRSKLYGPIRAELPFGTEPVDLANPVVLKLFGLSAEGMVAIDVRKCDVLTETGAKPSGCP